MDLFMENLTIFSNESTLVHNKFKSSFRPWEDYLIGVFLLLADLSALFLNALLLVVAIKQRKQLRNVDFYIVNLAICDIGHPLFGYPMAIIASFSHEWIFDETGCDIYGYLGFQFGVGSMTTLAVMSMVRYISVCNPSTAKLIRCQHVYLSIVCIHLYAAFWAVCPLIGWGRYDTEPYGISCTLDWTNPDRSFVVATFIFCLGAPSTIMTTSYCLLIKISRNASRKMQQWTLTDKAWSRQELYLLKITVLMCGFFLVAWLPYAIVSLLTVIWTGIQIPHRLTLFPALLAKSSHTINPIIYFLMNKKMRSYIPDVIRSKKSRETKALQRLRREPSRLTPTINKTSSGGNVNCKLSSE